MFTISQIFFNDNRIIVSNAAITQSKGNRCKIAGKKKLTVGQQKLVYFRTLLYQ